MLYSAVIGCLCKLIGWEPCQVTFTLYRNPLANLLGWALGSRIKQGPMMQGLWRGTVPGQLLAVPYTAVQFVALQQCRSFAKRHGLLEGDRAWLLSFVSGAAAGAAATMASYPFDTLRTILAAQGKPPVSPCWH